MLTLETLLHSLSPIAMGGGGDPSQIKIQGVTADSRTVRPGDLFVAVAGGRVDAHRFIVDALARGAVASVGTSSADDLSARGIVLPPHSPYIRVANSRRALATAAAALHGFPSRELVVFGVTGTDGKTTTSSLLEAILVAATRTDGDAAGKVGVVTTVGARICGVENDTGLHVTTPDAPEVQRFLADMVEAGCRYAVIESTSHGLDQERVGAVDFDIAVVTNITHEHLDYHGSRDAYVAAKTKLFRSLYGSFPKPGAPRCAVLNGDDPGSIDALRAALHEEAATQGVGVSERTYGVLRPPPSEALADASPLSPNFDVYASDLHYLPDRTHFVLHWWGGQFPVQTQLIGDFNVYNTLAAATAALAAGVAPAHVQQGIAHFAGVLGRMQRMDRGQPFLAVVDFAHSPASLERALTTLRPLVGVAPDNTPGRLIAVFGSAGLRDRAKRHWMGEISGRLADFTVITAEDPRTEDVHEINREIERGVCEHAGPDRYAVVADRGAAIQFAVDMARPGDIVAAFGKGHERSMCYGEVEYPWSDQQAMIEALDRRGQRER